LSGRPDTGLVTGSASEHNFCVGTGLCWTTPRSKLYQANIAARSDGGPVTPPISDFNARAKDGTTYRVIDTVATPDGIPPTPISQRQRSDGKIYFDVTGPPPNGVVDNDGAQDFLISTSNA
jgi:hypothetical protein